MVVEPVVKSRGVLELTVRDQLRYVKVFFKRLRKHRKKDRKGVVKPRKLGSQKVTLERKRLD